jgi:hypothetical protein
MRLGMLDETSLGVESAPGRTVVRATLHVVSGADAGTA